ncbi:hypothetical protein CN918_29125 [Priestia megaterium]|nr:hypothetical protein CN918_29125 [Priestia megaterium]
MNLTYTIDEIKKAGAMVEVKLTEDGITTKKFSIEKVTPKKVYFSSTISTLCNTNQPLQTTLLNRKVVVSGHNGYSFNEGMRSEISYYITGSAFILEKDVERVIRYLKEEAQMVIEKRIQQLQQQASLLKEIPVS